jgi:hypothetical protein
MDLKRELGKLLNVRPESLAIAEVQDGRMRTVHGVCSLSAYFSTTLQILLPCNY